jgi:hypothetical protein
MKLYRFFWTKEGFLWRRWNYVILPPKGSRTTWEVRRIYGEPGAQKEEKEGSFNTERKAFVFANRVIRDLKKAEKNHH